MFLSAYKARHAGADPVPRARHDLQVVDLEEVKWNVVCGFLRSHCRGRAPCKAGRQPWRANHTDGVRLSGA